MLNQDGMSERLKHIDVKFNFVKRLVRDKLVVCPHIATREMIADIFTKGLPDESFGGHSVTVLGRFSVKGVVPLCVYDTNLSQRRRIPHSHYFCYVEVGQCT